MIYLHERKSLASTLPQARLANLVLAHPGPTAFHNSHDDGWPSPPPHSWFWPLAVPVLAGGPLPPHGSGGCGEADVPLDHCSNPATVEHGTAHFLQCLMREKSQILLSVILCVFINRL